MMAAMSAHSACSLHFESMTSDIGIPNGPAEDSTRGLLKAHYPKNKKTRKPKDIIKES